MGMVVDADGEYAYETTGLPGSIRGTTMCGWFKLAGTRSGGNTHIAGLSDGGGTVASLRLANLDVTPLITGVEQGPSAKTIALGDEIFWAIVVESDGKVRVYVRKKAESSLSTSVTTNAVAAAGIARWLIGERDAGVADWAHGSHAYPRIWDAVLTESELLDESNSATAVRTDDLKYAEANGTLVDDAGSFSIQGSPTFDEFDPFAGGEATAALTGTAAAGITESDIVSGGKTIILTLTDDTWVASGATFDAIRQDIIDGLDSDGAEANGWDAEVKAKQGVNGVVRTSDTVVTITLDAQAGYDISATETITATIPATAVTGGVEIVATPTFEIDPVVASGGAVHKHLGLTGVG